MIQYCLGFARDQEGNYVLIEKNKPNWMAGRLNGVGGKVEPGEKFVTAMVREFREETGVETFEDDWRLRGVLNHRDYVMRVYRLTKPVERLALWSPTSERVLCVPVSEFNSQRLVSNLAWMAPLVFDDTIPDVFDFTTIGK